MSNYWGVAVPGLAMTAGELPSVPGLLILENPEIGNGPLWDCDNYNLVDVARYHASTIANLGCQEIFVIGMSMGGMIVSIMASLLRSSLPTIANFRVLVSSPNLAGNPALTPKMLADWRSVNLGKDEDYERILTPFFSKSYLALNHSESRRYFKYRSTGANKQSGRGFYRQVSAINNYDGALFWPKIIPEEMHVIGGNDDYVLGPTHSRDIRNLLPEAKHTQLSELGHMVNMERPELFYRSLDASI